MTPPAYKSRVNALARQLEESGLDVFLASSSESLGYLSGLRESGYERLLTLLITRSGDSLLVCPALTESQARRHGIDKIASYPDGDSPYESVVDYLSAAGYRAGVFAVDDDFRADHLLRLQQLLPAALFKAGGVILAELTSIKSETELDTMRVAARIADTAFVDAVRSLRPGMTETQFAANLMAAMQALGGRPTFCIVAAGANGAEPHHLSDETLLQAGDIVIIDFGCEVDGYQSDVTRTVALQTATEEARAIYSCVYQAQRAARDAIRPGIPAEEVDKAARDVIGLAGYGDYFTHRTGHGIGMRGHESPNIVAGNSRPLEVGNCFSIEPGIYLPGKFGVRIENIVTVVPEGHLSLNAEPAGELLVF